MQVFLFLFEIGDCMRTEAQKAASEMHREYWRRVRIGELPKPSNGRRRGAINTPEHNRRISEGVRKHLESVRSRSGFAPMSVTQAVVLREIVTVYEPIRLRDVAIRLNKTPSAVCRAIDALVGLGFAQRRPHPHDGRGKLIDATREGIDADRRIRALMTDGLSDLGGFPIS